MPRRIIWSPNSAITRRPRRIGVGRTVRGNTYTVSPVAGATRRAQGEASQRRAGGARVPVIGRRQLEREDGAEDAHMLHAGNVLESRGGRAMGALDRLASLGAPVVEQRERRQRSGAGDWVGGV
jgi:hypothetical protein